MRHIIGIILALSMVLVALPIEASHGHSVSRPYASGGGYQVVGTSLFGLSYCGTEAIDPSLGCLGGATVRSQHWVVGTPDGEQDFAQGYTIAIGVATDAAFGPNVGLSLCLPSQVDYGANTGTRVTCDNNRDRRVTGCATSLVANTNEYAGPTEQVQPGFRALEALFFIRSIYVDPSTTLVCVSSNGSVSATFSG